MASNDLYQVTFEWPHTSPSSVVVTGTFDHWSQTLHLTKDSSGFRGSTTVPWDEKIIYKFIVDGQWVVDDSKPTENDGSGNINNVFTAPSKPLPPSEPEGINSGPVVQTDVPVEGKDTSTLGSFIPQLASDAVKTVLAVDGTSSALEYVASGVGAAIHTVTGIDPINADKIPIESPKTEEPEEPEPLKTEESTPAAEVTPSAEPLKESQEPLSAPVIPASTDHVKETVSETVSTPVEASTHTPVTVPVPSPSTETNGVSHEPKADTEKSQPTAAVSLDSTKAAETETKTNGTVNSSAPSTPSKHRRSVSAIFPRSESPNSDLSPTSSRFGSVSSIRKKRTSLFGKVKGIFSRDKEKRSGLHHEVS
ncbi:Cruciform DNA binding protein [Stygiomarasmius scandens]|uniref:Cruciform DNA binding protein n=1 Tax=Marasmiellus scandens TaxID=2682957 RepID=A0ABR1K5E7_9AGAR